ncbi:hypothetical protein A3753_12360 [Sulfitobacter sp. HI0082]|nr:hypothetical protein A3753_21240 [Sulfitobacter sp. HI0082]KZZ28554.1 hypothetical protein A3753_12360 [Sulfitobacter sp. HI0082]
MVAANGVRRLGHNFVALRAVSQDEISDNWKMVGSEPSRMICLTALQYRLRAAIYAVQRENGPTCRERLHVAVSRELSVQYPPHCTSGNPIVQIAHEHRTFITLPNDLHKLFGLLASFTKTQTKMCCHNVQRAMGCIHHCFDRRAWLAPLVGNVMIARRCHRPATYYRMAIVAVRGADQTGCMAVAAKFFV